MMGREDPLHPDATRTVAFFTNLLRDHPTGPEALNWGSKFSQELRFSILAEIGMPKGASVLDVGCGLGDFHGWQKKQGLELKYHGVDITPAMVEAARKRFTDATFEVSDLLDNNAATYDFVFASGIFYLRREDPQIYLEQTIEKLFQKCRQGIAFNTLSLWSPRRDADEFYADPLRTLDFCRKLSPLVTLRHDYHPGDFTIHLRRSPKTP